MKSEENRHLAEPGQTYATGVFERMFAAVDKVRERLERACKALGDAGVSYAVIGGNAVAAWVATIDDGAVRNTRDVDLLLDEKDLDRATVALTNFGFVRSQVMDVIVFLDGANGKPSQGLHVLLAGQTVRESDICPTPQVSQSTLIEDKRVIELASLVKMKLNAFRDKDKTHLRDMIQIGLLDSSWPARLEPELGRRLQTLLDDPDG